jgi:hypothetical protein
MGSSKAHLRYWEEVIFQRRDGGNWWVQIHISRDRHRNRNDLERRRTAILHIAAPRVLVSFRFSLQPE